MGHGTWESASFWNGTEFDGAGGIGEVIVSKFGFWDLAWGDVVWIGVMFMERGGYDGVEEGVDGIRT
jgi:hypothetical protein